jgi:hypothetical protein
MLRCTEIAYDYGVILIAYFCGVCVKNCMKSVESFPVKSFRQDFRTFLK